MAIKSVSSTDAKKHFGQILSDTTHNQNRYIVERREIPQAFIISFNDLEAILNDPGERSKLLDLIENVKPEYNIGKNLE